MTLQELKDYLKITWTEEDQTLQGMIKTGEAYLNGIAGTTIDFTVDLNSKQLLKDYCRYVYNHSLEYFETNFKHELLKLSLKKAVELHEAETTA